MSQVKRYFRTILAQDEFNGSNRFWEFYLVGNGFDNSGYIEQELENSRRHGEKSLLFSGVRQKIYVKTWSEIFAEFDLRHQFLNDKLELERSRLVEEDVTANGLVRSMTTDNSAVQPPSIIAPKFGSGPAAS